MKFFSTLLICAAALAAVMPAEAQGRRRPSSKPAAASTKDEAEPKESKTGIRFVICSADKVALPSPLYARTGKVFSEVRIGARKPSMRLKPTNGVVNFWDKNPNPAADLEAKNPGKKSETKLPEPTMSIPVPAGIGNKAICILSPHTDPKKTQAVFLNEQDFPRRGMHIINLTALPLTLTTWEKQDFSDKEDTKIGVYYPNKGITPDNSWVFKGKDGQTMNFKLSYIDKNTKKPRPLKASAFVVSDSLSTINIVVKGANQARPTILPIQLVEKDDKE